MKKHIINEACMKNSALCGYQGEGIEDIENIKRSDTVCEKCSEAYKYVLSDSYDDGSHET